MRANKSMRLIFLAAALFALPYLATAQQGEIHVGKVTGRSDAGRQLYFRFCWGCHGFRGDGNGENGPYLNILPRNFVAATFKCRSTPTGTLPTDEDLYNSVGRGFNNSNMPAWISLTKQQRADMVAFIKPSRRAGRPTSPAISSMFPPSPRSPWIASSTEKNSSPSWNAGSAMAPKAAAMVPPLPRLRTATINRYDRTILPRAPASSAARPTMISIRFS